MNEVLKRGIFNALAFLPDKTYISLMYLAKMKKPINWKNPQTFNEKIQWLKLYDRKPIYTTMVDKYAAKYYVAERIGEEYIIPTLGVWDSFDEIDFDSLPDRFVLKCTHDSGGLVICKDKSKLDMAAAKKKIEKSLKSRYYLYGREWQYKDVKPRIIAEKFMEDSETGELRDYKFFCFNGVPRLLFVASDRFKENEDVKFDFFDMDYNHIEVENGHPMASVLPEKPVCFEQMRQLAAKLSEGVPQLRVDFYEVDGKVYFGELTFAHWSGMMPFNPEKWDRIFGEWIELPESNN